MADLNIQRDAKVLAADGELGEVKHVVVDPETKEVTYLVVEGKHGQSMVPITAVRSVEGDRVTLNGAGAQFTGTRFERDQYHAIDADEVRAETARTATHGGAPVVDAKDDQVEIAGRQQREAVRETAAPVRGQQAGAGAEGYRLQLMEERLRPTTKREQAGEVTLGKKVVEHQESLTVPVTEERVVIERTPVSGETPARGALGTDETVEVPVMKERVDVEKEAVVREEVGVRKETVQHTEQVQGTVRREELAVEDGQELVNETGGTDERQRRLASQEGPRPSDLPRGEQPRRS